MARGEWTTFQGRKVPPVYTPKHSTIIDMLGLTDDEMTQLDVIITDDIKKDRDRDRKRSQRREAGAVDRETYNSNRLLASTDKKVMAIELVVNLGKTTREAAEILGVNQSTVSRWTK
jgi:DNA-directed RNA polymerase specialized sigma subunit